MKIPWVTLVVVTIVTARPERGSRKYLPTGDNDFYNQNSNSGPLPPMKHLYFYEAPEEQAQPPPQYVFKAPPKPVKSTRIIFIKAPHYKFVPEVVVPPAPSSHDRTIVYILSRQPEDSYITIPASVGPRPAKPEVYFIKYGDKGEAQTQVNAGLYGGGTVGANVPSLENEDKFINYLDNVKQMQRLIMKYSSPPAPMPSQHLHLVPFNYVVGYPN
ncbi:hypothetical protein PPYR_11242 [Photinus pyralis]|uniref:DUF243 domain-containing protein n=1 Tax=Photinus pyralis TaxID=7054 RepID=A0A5N4AAQ5_PHOPY|nr:hypothetical protein PPYR_11242 [Photinus pyralis]